MSLSFCNLCKRTFSQDICSARLHECCDGGYARYIQPALLYVLFRLQLLVIEAWQFKPLAAALSELFTRPK